MGGGWGGVRWGEVEVGLDGFWGRVGWWGGVGRNEWRWVGVELVGLGWDGVKLDGLE